MTNLKNPIQPVTGQYADYFDTGIWDMTPAATIAPKDITIQQLKDFLLATGGAVYLRKDNRFGWLPTSGEGE
jgi:hypothetical protein